MLLLELQDWNSGDTTYLVFSFCQWIPKLYVTSLQQYCIFWIISHFVIYYPFRSFSIIYAVVLYFLFFNCVAFEEKSNAYASPLAKWKTSCCVPDSEEYCYHLIRSLNSLKWIWTMTNPYIFINIIYLHDYNINFISHILFSNIQG